MSSLRLTDVPGAAGILPLDTPVPGQPGRFRRIVMLSLATGGSAETLHLLDGAVLAVEFSERAFDARAAGAPVTAQLVRERQELVLRLPRAYTIARIDLAQPQHGDALLGFRFDGEAVAPDPVATAAVAASGAALLRVEAAELILRRRRGTSVEKLNVSDVSGVRLRAPPVLPRVAFRIVGDTEGWQPLPAPGAGGDGAAPPASVDHGAALAAALGRAVDRWRAREMLALLPDPLRIDLAFEADSPCRVRVTALELDWRLGRGSLPGGDSKLVLRLAPEALRPVAAEIEVPAASAFDLGTLEFTLARGGGSGSAGPGSAVPAVAAAPPASGEGRRLRAGGLLAGRFVLEAPQVVAALETAVGGIEGTCTVRLRAWADAGGLPGSPLFAGAPLDVPPGAPRLRRSVLDALAVADAGPLWLGLEAVKGDALAALASGSGEGIAESDATGWAAPAALAGRRLLALTVPPEGATDTNGSAQRLRLTLGDVEVPLSGGPDAFSADLRPALAATAPSAGPAQPRTLALSGPGPAVVTVRPPSLRYTPA